jgi:hypothetical protein
MRFFIFISTLLLLCSISITAYGAPVFKVRKAYKIHKVRSGGGTTVYVDVFLPKGQHIYIKNLSSLSFNNATKFEIPSKYGFGVSIAKLPRGKKKDQDLILKGRGRRYKAGTYTLRIYETKGRRPNRRIHKFRLNIWSQACNTVSNMCYRPGTQYKYLKVIVNKKKNMKLRSARSMSRIKWITSYKKAFAKAKKTKQNIFVVITAPKWCGYCIVLEKKVFAKSSVSKVLNKKFIALRILDTNSDKRKFKFIGYPTMIMMDHRGKELTRSIPRSESSFLTTISRYEKNPSGSGGKIVDKKDPIIHKKDKGDVYSYTVRMKGTFYQMDSTWYQKSSNGRIIDRFKIQRKDPSYIILKSLKNKEFIAIPINGNRGYRFINQKWVPLFTIEKR